MNPRSIAVNGTSPMALGTLTQVNRGHTPRYFILREGLRDFEQHPASRHVRLQNR